MESWHVRLDRAIPHDPHAIPSLRLRVSAIKSGRPGNGFVAAIEQCGAVLAAHLPPGALKRDELPDKLLEIRLVYRPTLTETKLSEA
jgi:putative membrane protein